MKNKYHVLAIIALIGLFLPLRQAFAAIADVNDFDASSASYIAYFDTSNSVSGGGYVILDTPAGISSVTGDPTNHLSTQSLFTYLYPGSGTNAAGTWTVCFITPPSLQYQNCDPSNKQVFYSDGLGTVTNITPSFTDETRFTLLSPDRATTTATTTLSATIYINQNDFDPDMYVEMITQRYNRRDILDSDPNYRDIKFYGLSPGPNTVSTTTYFSVNEIVAYTANLNKPYGFFDIFTQQYTSSSTNFTVATTSEADAYYASINNAKTAYVTGYSSSTRDQACDGSTTITEKAICAMGGIISNVLQTLFQPSQASMDQFSTIKDVLTTKPPIGYFYSIVTSLKDLNASSTPAFVLQQDSSLMTNIFTPLRSGIQGILWFVFAVWYFIRFKNMQI